MRNKTGEWKKLHIGMNNSETNGEIDVKEERTQTLEREGRDRRTPKMQENFNNYKTISEY